MFDDSFDDADKSVTTDTDEEEDDELDIDDLLLPWSCCIPNKLIEEPEAMANKIRNRLVAKSQVAFFHLMRMCSMYCINPSSFHFYRTLIKRMKKAVIMTKFLDVLTLGQPMVEGGIS